jgi:hypothetical protein
LTLQNTIPLVVDFPGWTAVSWETDPIVEVAVSPSVLTSQGIVESGVELKIFVEFIADLVVTESIVLVAGSPGIDEHVIGIEVSVYWVQSLVEDVLVRIYAICAFSLDDNWQVLAITSFLLSGSDGFVVMSIEVELIWHVLWRAAGWATGHVLEAAAHGILSWVWCSSGSIA